MICRGRVVSRTWCVPPYALGNLHVAISGIGHLLPVSVPSWVSYERPLLMVLWEQGCREIPIEKVARICRACDFDEWDDVARDMERSDMDRHRAFLDRIISDETEAFISAHSINGK